MLKLLGYKEIKYYLCRSINQITFIMREQLRQLLSELSASDFSKVKQLYRMTNGIKGDTIDEFLTNIPDDKTIEGVTNLCNKQLGR